MPASTTQRLVRTRGIEAPYNKDQVASMVLHPVISIAFVALCALTLAPTTVAIILAPFVPLEALLAGFWGYVSLTDPAGEGGCKLRRKSADTPHYCSFCRKTVKGFDHHCSWLNTCISRRNYMHFYLLALTGTLLYMYMVAVAMLVQFLVDESDLADGFGSVPTARWSWGVFAAVSGWIAFSFVALTGFHTYLLCIGMGTFDWVVLQGQKRTEKLANRRTRTAANSDGSRSFSSGWMGCWRGKDGRRRPRVRHTAVQDVSSVSVPRPASGVAREGPALSDDGKAGRPVAESIWGGVKKAAGAVTRQASDTKRISSGASTSSTSKGDGEANAKADVSSAATP